MFFTPGLYSYILFYLNMVVLRNSADMPYDHWCVTDQPLIRIYCVPFCGFLKLRNAPIDLIRNKNYLCICLYFMTYT